ncbi:MAG: hypothetical protein KKA42_16800 [candidate division Zixibacteria bacterium]|nr:hypothetical protein [candidate division Zixibacteria bacterium]
MFRRDRIFYGACAIFLAGVILALLDFEFALLFIVGAYLFRPALHVFDLAWKHADERQVQIHSQTGALRILAGIALLVLTGGSISFGSDTPVNAAVQKAYDLRLDGQVDAARLLLEEYTLINDTNASAWYELARTFYYMAPGQPRMMKYKVKSAATAISKAVALEPDNPLYRYFAAQVQFLNSYMALQENEDSAKSYVNDMCRAYDAVLEVQPGHPEVLLNLVELYGTLPAAWGGDTVRATQYADQLPEADYVVVGKAHCILMPEDFDRIGYWQELLLEHPGDASVLDELGRTCLRAGESDKGTAYLHEALQADPANTLPYLVLANHHILRVLRDVQTADVSLPLAMEALNEYLATEPIPAYKGYALGILSKLNYYLQNNVEADSLSKEARATDDFYSKATAIPLADLFVPPGVMPHHHTYLLQPF